MNEEKFLEERMPKRNPFQVPEGYFGHFAEQVMQSLPEREPAKLEEPKAKHVLLRPWMYAAACLLVAFLCVIVYFSRVNGEVTEAPQQMAVTDSYIDEAADYVMLDNAEIYACLADN